MVNKRVIAYYKGKEITSDEIRYQIHFLDTPDEKQAVFQLLLVREITDLARKENLSIDKESLQQRIETFQNAAKYSDQIRSLNISGEELEQSLLMDELLNAWMDAEHQIDENELNELYELRFKDIKLPVTYHIRHILITTENAATAENRDVIYKKIQMIQKEKLPFEDLAMKYSECPSAVQGGDLGWVRAEDLYPEIAQAIIHASPGSEPVIAETQMGFHLVQLLEKNEPRPITEEEGKKAARKKYKEVKNKLIMQQMMKQIQKETVFCD